MRSVAGLTLSLTTTKPFEVAEAGIWSPKLTLTTATEFPSTPLLEADPSPSIPSCRAATTVFKLEVGALIFPLSI